MNIKFIEDEVAVSKSSHFLCDPAKHRYKGIPKTLSFKYAADTNTNRFALSNAALFSQDNFPTSHKHSLYSCTLMI